MGADTEINTSSINKKPNAGNHASKLLGMQMEDLQM
jgi:hypothetical protein